MASSILVPALLIFFPASMALAASMDLLTMTIPNRLCLALAVGFFILAPVVGVPFHAMLINLSCGAAMLALTFALFAMGWIGGGDAKLTAATALWLGWGVILDYGIFAAICGGGLTLAILAARRISLPSILVRHGWIARLHDQKSGVPYGIALAVAGIMVYPQTQFWQTLAIR